MTELVSNLDRVPHSRLVMCDLLRGRYRCVFKTEPFSGHKLFGKFSIAYILFLPTRHNLPRTGVSMASIFDQGSQERCRFQIHCCQSRESCGQDSWADERKNEPPSSVKLFLPRCRFPNFENFPECQEENIHQEQFSIKTKQ